MAIITFVGFGELGAALARRLGRSSAHELRVWTRHHSDPEADAALAKRLSTAPVRHNESLSETIRGADAVLAVVPASASRSMATDCAQLLETDALYVDLSSAAPSDKEAGSETVEEAGGRYADATVLGTAAMGDDALRIIASGGGASTWQRLAGEAGLGVEVLDGPAGRAALLKLLRSSYMKGRDALIVETLLAARRYGLEEMVAASITGPGEAVSFTELAERVLKSLAVHAERRAEELRACGELIQASGLEPFLALAGAEVLQAVADTEVCDLFKGERPQSGIEVLAVLDERIGLRSTPGDADAASG